MKNYELIWAENDQSLIESVNQYLAEHPGAFLLGGPTAVAVGAPPTPHGTDHKGWYQAAAENT